MTAITHQKYDLRKEIVETIGWSLRWKSKEEVYDLVAALTDSLGATMSVTELKSWAQLVRHNKEQMLASADRYFSLPGCTCRRIELDIGAIGVGGRDDCPVHGFGAEE